MKANKEEMQALFTAFDIHRRAATLAAMWTAFDPFGAVVYILRDFEAAAWDLRENVNILKDSWDYAEAPNHPLRKIKEGKDKYGTLRNHVKGIEGAMRRLSRNKYIIRNFGKNGLMKSYKYFGEALSLVRGEL